MGIPEGDRERIIYYAFWDTCGAVMGGYCWILATITPERASITKSGERTGPVVPGVQVEVLTRFGMKSLVRDRKGALRAAVRRTGIPTAAWEYCESEVVSDGTTLGLRSLGEDAPNTYGTTFGQGWWTVYERSRIQRASA